MWFKDLEKIHLHLTADVSVYLALLQVKYKESFDRQLKGQKPQYNPLECVSFKQTQAAAALASQVSEPWSHDQSHTG